MDDDLSRHLKGVVWSCLGFWVLGVWVPALLYFWQSNTETLRELPPLVAYMSMWLMPLGAFLTVILQWMMWRFIEKNGGDKNDDVAMEQVIRRGLIYGTALGFLNLPLYVAWHGLEGFYAARALKLLLLVVLHGGLSSWWTAWQAWRIVHADAPFFPRYSLKWLVIFVVFCAGVMAVFAPKRTASSLESEMRIQSELSH